MTLDLSTYERGYYGYMNQEVRDALGELQDTGAVRAVVASAAQLASIATPKTRDLAIVVDEQQLYAWNESAGSWLAIGASQSVLQQLIDGSFDGGVTTLLASNTLVPADGTAPLADPTGQTAGWYYKNSNNISDKINWYYASNSNPAVNMTLTNFTAQYAVIDVRAKGGPFFAVYTKPTGSGDAASWYKSRLVYIPAGLDLTAYIGQTIFLHWGVDTGDFPTLPRVECTLDPVSSVGTQDPSEEVLFANFSTSTGYEAGRYEFVVSALGYELNNSDVQFILSSVGALAPAAGDTHYVTLDGVNDYINLTGTGNCFDLSAGAEWTLGFTVDAGYAGNSDKLSTVQSGSNSHVLYNGGLHSTFGNGAGALSWNTASYMTGVQAGDKIAFRANGTKVQLWWNGVLKHQATLGTGGVTTGTPNSLTIGNATTSSAVGAVPNWNTSVDNLMVCSGSGLTDAELAEFFASDDFALYSFAGTKLTDFVTMGEDTYPNITGENAVVTGTLVNGTTANFVERV